MKRYWLSMLIYGRLPRCLSFVALMCALFCALSMPVLAGVVNGVTIQKVLPHLLDKKGRHTLSPSLLERDAYQAKLRSESALQGGLKFDIRLGRIPEGAGLVLHLETHGTTEGSQPSYIQFQRPIPDKDRFHRWFNITLSPEEYAKLGKLISWRVTLRQGETVVAEQRSFLW